MIYTRIIFERLTSAHYPVLRYYLSQHKEIKFFGNAGSVNNRKWVTKLVKQGQIIKIPPVGYVYHDCYGTALDNLEKFYPHYTGRSIPGKQMARLFGDETIGMAYKKELTRQLAEYYYINSYLHDEEGRLGDKERIIFISQGYQRFLRLAEASGAFYHRHEKIDFALWANIPGHLYGLWQKTKAWFWQSCIIAYCLIKLVSSRGDRKVKEYKYAIAVRSPDYQFKFKSRPVDFLLDGGDINRDNTVFLLLNPAITRENRDEMKAGKLDVLDASGRSVASPGFSAGDKLRTVARVLPYAAGNLFLGLFDNPLVLDVNNILLPVFFKWSAILSRVSFKHFITLNDEGIDHIGRNILLHKAGAMTWYYAHSSSVSSLRILPRHWLWSFLYYDWYIAWDDWMIEYYKSHPQKIGAYRSIGCIWSQSITDLLKGDKALNLKLAIFPGYQPDKFKVISFFDSSYVPDSVSPMEDGVTFFRSVLKLLAEFPDIMVIIKEKKSAESVLEVYRSFGGTDDVFYHQYQPALEELRKHPRCRVTGYKGDPAEVIAVSDLTVTYAFSSTTVEALGAGKKAIFYDPGNRYPDCYLDRIPGLMAHNYEGLKQLIQKLLYKTSDEEYRSFLNANIKGLMDPYLDGKAVTRFRDLLKD